ncbi:MAG: efflux RND transporter periplasmic adaptor subunit [Candidatus Omnitrophica bacterium]|nr:efflux RND transporter periplasmic adaptor subunit [Candidatus Omnitrophota bacterium]
MKKYGFAAFALILSVSLMSCGKNEEVDSGPVVRPVKMMEVGAVESGSVRSYPGNVRASQQVDLAFQVSGPIVELPVNEGDLVEAGQMVAQIRKEDFITALNNAKSRLETAQSQLQAMESGARPEDVARLESQVSAAQAKFKTTEVDFNRNKELLREGVIPQSRFDMSQAAFEVSKSQLASAHKELEIGLVGARPEDIAAKKAEVQSIQSSLDQAEIDLADTTLKAPFTGRIAKKYVDNFQNIQSKEPVVSLQDITNVEVIINLPETDVITTKRENINGVYAEFDSVKDRKFDLKIKEFSTEADSQTQTYKATLVMPAPEDVNILPGMTAKVSIDYGTKTSETQTGFRVPLASILNETQEDNFVWKVDPSSMEVTKVPVELGTMTGDDVVVTQGVATGDLIATAGVHFLHEGMKVKRLNPPAQTEGEQGS